MEVEKCVQCYRKFVYTDTVDAHFNDAKALNAETRAFTCKQFYEHFVCISDERDKLDDMCNECKHEELMETSTRCLHTYCRKWLLLPHQFKWNLLDVFDEELAHYKNKTLGLNELVAAPNTNNREYCKDCF